MKMIELHLGTIWQPVTFPLFPVWCLNLSTVSEIQTILLLGLFVTILFSQIAIWKWLLCSSGSCSGRPICNERFGWNEMGSTILKIKNYNKILTHSHCSFFDRAAEFSAHNGLVCSWSFPLLLNGMLLSKLFWQLSNSLIWPKCFSMYFSINT